MLCSFFLYTLFQLLRVDVLCPTNVADKILVASPILSSRCNASRDIQTPDVDQLRGS